MDPPEPSSRTPRPNTLAGGVSRPNTIGAPSADDRAAGDTAGTGSRAGARSAARPWPWSRGPQAADDATPAAECAAAVDAFLDRLARVRPDEAWRLAGLWDQVDPAARERAHRSVREAVTGNGRLGLLRSVQQAVIRWGAGGFVATEISMPTLGRRVDIGDAQAAAARAALDAGSAVAVRDLIDAADFGALYGPWEEAIGEG